MLFVCVRVCEVTCVTIVRSRRRHNMKARNTTVLNPNGQGRAENRKTQGKVET